MFPALGGDYSVLGGVYLLLDFKKASCSVYFLVSSEVGGKAEARRFAKSQAPAGDQLKVVSGARRFGSVATMEKKKAPQ